MVEPYFLSYPFGIKLRRLAWSVNMKCCMQVLNPQNSKTVFLLSDILGLPVCNKCTVCLKNLMNMDVLWISQFIAFKVLQPVCLNLSFWGFSCCVVFLMRKQPRQAKLLLLRLQLFSFSHSFLVAKLGLYLIRTGFEKNLDLTWRNLLSTAACLLPHNVSLMPV